MTALLRRTRRRSPIGLDVGSTGVRGAQLVRTGDTFDVLRAAWSERPGGEDAGREGANTAADGEAVRACLRKTEFQGRSAVVGLNLPEADFHLLELPETILEGKANEASSAVHWEVVRLMDTASDAVEVRHWMLPTPSSAAPNALGVGAARACVDSTLESCAAAGLRCRGIDTAATALSRFGCLLGRRPANVVWGMLDLGYRHTRLLLCVGEVPVLVRNVGSGGGMWTQRIAESLQLSVRAAEVHKRQHGIARRARGRRVERTQAPERELGAMLLSALRGDLNEIASQVKRSYEYALSCYAKHTAGELILVGGGARMQRLGEFWSNVLGIPVRCASSYLEEAPCRLRYATGHGHPVELMAAAIGLAIESTE